MHNAGLLSRVSYAALGACAMALSACASSRGKPEIVDADFAERPSAAHGRPDLDADLRNYGKASHKYKKSVGVFTNPQADTDALDPIAAAAYWGSRYDKDSGDVEAAVNYSEALRKIGSVDEAVSVMMKTAPRVPDNADVNLETGRALIEADRAFEAVRYVENALTARKRDWRALSVYGVALDQIGEHKLAREKYDAALLIKPDAVSVMSNKGLSYAMSGDLNAAISTLQLAAISRNADTRIRQNFALVLAIKGDLPQAERLARSDLPPQIADQNVQFYRQLVNQPAYWQSLAGADVDTPKFAPAAATSTEAPAALTQPETLTPKKQKSKKAPKETAPLALEGAATADKAALEVPEPAIPATKDAED